MHLLVVLSWCLQKGVPPYVPAKLKLSTNPAYIPIPAPSPLTKATWQPHPKLCRLPQCEQKDLHTSWCHRWRTPQCRNHTFGPPASHRLPSNSSRWTEYVNYLWCSSRIYVEVYRLGVVLILEVQKFRKDEFSDGWHQCHALRATIWW